MIQRRNSDLDVEERFTREGNRLPEKDLDKIAKAYHELLQSIGENVDRQGLRREARARERENEEERFEYLGHISDP